jgi:peptidoglycan/xylan/chitin deacetylase (PgdA/CDA1 family)
LPQIYIMVNVDATWIEAGLATAAAAAAGCGYLGYAVRGRSSSFFAPSVYRGDPSRAVLALTFDDGPSESTPALLRLLETHKVRATFFMCGANVRRLPGIAQEVAAAGHEIGNHTETHSRFDFKSPDFIYQEIAVAQEAIHNAAATTPRLFRAPYGVRWFGLRDAQERLGLTGVMWTVIGRDWTLSAQPIADRLLNGVANGGVLCLHDGRAINSAPDIGNTIEAVRIALPRLLERGFSFQTATDLLCIPPPSKN